MLQRASFSILGVFVLIGALVLPERSGFAQINPTHRVIDLTNSERQKVGMPPLFLHSSLMQAAQTYAEVLATGECFGHNCGAVPNFTDRAEQAGYTGWIALGENIAAGAATPEAVITMWMNSSGHRANMLNANYTEIGVGLAQGGPYGNYWVLVLGARSQSPAQFKAFMPFIARATQG